MPGFDPGETRDLGESTDHRDLRSTCEAALRAIVDPEEESAAASQLISHYGGYETVRARGDFGYTPAPGQTPVFA